MKFGKGGAQALDRSIGHITYRDASLWPDVQRGVSATAAILSRTLSQHFIELLSLM